MGVEEHYMLPQEILDALRQFLGLLMSIKKYKLRKFWGGGYPRLHMNSRFLIHVSR